MGEVSTLRVCGAVLSVAVGGGDGLGWPWCVVGVAADTALSVVVLTVRVLVGAATWRAGRSAAPRRRGPREASADARKPPRPTTAPATKRKAHRRLSPRDGYMLRRSGGSARPLLGNSSMTTMIADAWMETHAMTDGGTTDHRLVQAGPAGRGQPGAAARGRSGAPVVPVYVTDWESADRWRPGAAGRWWLERSLERLSAVAGRSGRAARAGAGPRRGGHPGAGPADGRGGGRVEPSLRAVCTQSGPAGGGALQGTAWRRRSFNAGLLFEPQDHLSRRGTAVRTVHSVLAQLPVFADRLNRPRRGPSG